MRAILVVLLLVTASGALADPLSLKVGYRPDGGSSSLTPEGVLVDGALGLLPPQLANALNVPNTTVPWAVPDAGLFGSTSVMSIGGAARVLIGGPTDDSAHTLQVNGSALATTGVTVSNAALSFYNTTPASTVNSLVSRALPSSGSGANRIIDMYADSSNTHGLAFGIIGASGGNTWISNYGSAAIFSSSQTNAGGWPMDFSALSTGGVSLTEVQLQDIALRIFGNTNRVGFATSGHDTAQAQVQIMCTPDGGPSWASEFTDGGLSAAALSDGEIIVHDAQTLVDGGQHQAVALDQLTNALGTAKPGHLVLYAADGGLIAGNHIEAQQLSGSASGTFGAEIGGLAGFNAGWVGDCSCIQLSGGTTSYDDGGWWAVRVKDKSTGSNTLCEASFPCNQGAVLPANPFYCPTDPDGGPGFAQGDVVDLEPVKVGSNGCLTDPTEYCICDLYEPNN